MIENRDTPAKIGRLHVYALAHPIDSYALLDNLSHLQHQPLILSISSAVKSLFFSLKLHVFYILMNVQGMLI